MKRMFGLLVFGHLSPPLCAGSRPYVVESVLRLLVGVGINLFSNRYFMLTTVQNLRDQGFIHPC